MCLGIPGKITAIFEQSGMRMGTVDFGGALREVCLEAVPDAKIGDFTIVHAGFGLNILSEEEAMETLALLREIASIDDEIGGESAPV